MKPSTSPVQSCQTKYQFASVQSYLSYELGSAIKSLPPLYTRILAGSLTLIFFSALGWAAFDRYDVTTEAAGKVTTTMDTKPISATAAAKLRQIHVAEGQHVTKGDLLVQLDPDMTQSEVERLRNQVKLNQADLNRLNAERNGKTEAGDALQNQLLAARWHKYSDRHMAAVADANRQLGALKAAQVQLGSIQNDLSYASIKAHSLSTLLDVGAIPRFDYMDAKNKAESLQSSIAAQQQQINQAEQAYQAALANVKQIEHERQEEILIDINKQQKDLTDLQSKLEQSQLQQKETGIVAPVSGTAYNVKVTLTEASVQAGEELLSIIPDGQGLILKANIHNKDVGFVRSQLQQTVRIKIKTFPYQEFGTIDGKVIQVSPNSVEQKPSDANQEDGSIYPVEIQLNQNFIPIGNHQVSLQPGMEVEADIVIRKRSILSFLLEPIISHWDKAFAPR